MEQLTFADLERDVAEYLIGTSVAAVHGGLAGLAAGGAEATLGEALQLLEIDVNRAPPDDSALAALAARTWRAYRDGFVAELELPDDSTALTDRVAAMVEWIDGFLGGFGISGIATDRLDEDSLEALDDLVQLARAETDLDSETGDEADEAALVELIEFVRVATMLLAASVRSARDDEPDEGPLPLAALRTLH